MVVYIFEDLGLSSTRLLGLHEHNSCLHDLGGHGLISLPPRCLLLASDISSHKANLIVSQNISLDEQISKVFTCLSANLLGFTDKVGYRI